MPKPLITKKPNQKQGYLYSGKVSQRKPGNRQKVDKMMTIKDLKNSQLSLKNRIIENDKIITNLMNDKYDGIPIEEINKGLKNLKVTEQQLEQTEKAQTSPEEYKKWNQEFQQERESKKRHFTLSKSESNNHHDETEDLLKRADSIFQNNNEGDSLYSREQQHAGVVGTNEDVPNQPIRDVHLNHRGTDDTNQQVNENINNHPEDNLSHNDFNESHDTSVHNKDTNSI